MDFEHLLPGIKGRSACIDGKSGSDAYPDYKENQVYRRGGHWKWLLVLVKQEADKRRAGDYLGKWC